MFRRLVVGGIALAFVYAAMSTMVGQIAQSLTQSTDVVATSMTLR